MAESNKRQQSGNRKPKSGTSGRGSGPLKGRGSSGRKGYEEQNTEFMRAEVVIICSFAVAILLFLSNFKLCGIVGDVLRGLQLGIFGMAGYVVPVLLFVGTCFHLSNQGNVHATLKLAAVALALVTICALLQLLFGTVPAGASWGDYYKQSGADGNGGGWLGGVVASLLTIGIGKAGTFVLLVVVFIICMVIITERSFVGAVKRGGGKAYRYAKEDMDRRKEIHAQREKERARLREEQRVRGVNLDATRLSPGGEEDGAVYDKEAFDREFGADSDHMSPANEFRGKFDPPLGGGEGSPYSDLPYEKEDAGSLARSIEGHSRRNGDGPRPVPVAAGVRYEDELGFHEEEAEPIYAPRDTRTLEEMEMRPPFRDARDVYEEIPWDEERAGSGGGGQGEDLVLSEQGAANSKVKNRFGGSYPDCADNESAFSEDAPGAGNNGGAFSENASGAANYGRDIAENPSGAVNYENGFAGYAPEYGTNENELKGMDSEFSDDHTPPSPRAAGVFEEEKDMNSQDTSQEGVNYDSFFIPEEPKQVVTASGKVIETETELLQKKLEKKREEAVKTNPNLAVADEIKKKEELVKKEYIFPPTRLLKKGVRAAGAFSGDEYKATAIKLQQTLHNFGVGVTVTNISCGPAVTRYELLPEQGVKVSRIVGLTDDIKLSLAATDIRIEAPIPGKSAVGIEVPNKENNMVYLRELLESDAFNNHKSRLAFAVGKDIGGQTVVTDIGKMPHLLIAGATGSGKSVCINTLIMSVIFKARPEDVKLIMIDPKVVELSVYNGIPHLLIPVVTDPKKASGALNWAVAEMEDRYKKFAVCNVRDLKGYNDRVEKLPPVEDEKKPEKLPQIVIIIDELADLMMVAPGEVEDSICRLAQLARAAGIHLVIATQRPSVNVITGLIKANVPSRIAFSVSSGVDSRTIIDMNGAEKLLGKGDMLFYPAGFPKPQRVQGAFVSDEEVGRVVDFLTEQGMVAQYSPEVESRVSSPVSEAGGGVSGRDEYFVQAGRFIIDKDKASIGMLQRMFKIGFNRAARIMDQLAEAGVVGEEEGTKPRKVLMSTEEFEELMEQGG